MSEEAGWFGIKRGLRAWLTKNIPSVEYTHDDNVERLNRIYEGAKMRTNTTLLFSYINPTTNRIFRAPKWEVYERTGRYPNQYEVVYRESKGEVVQIDPITFVAPLNQKQ
jgi:hypothetical protein